MVNPRVISACRLVGEVAEQENPYSERHAQHGIALFYDWAIPFLPVDIPSQFSDHPARN